MRDSQAFYNENHQSLLQTHQRMEEDENFGTAVLVSTQSNPVPFTFRRNPDMVPVAIIHNYAFAQRLKSLPSSPFAQFSVAELEHGIRIDRFAAINVHWLLRQDQFTLSIENRNVINFLATMARRHAVAWLLELPDLNTDQLYPYRWTLFLNCALGRLACIHFRPLNKGTLLYNRKYLDPRGISVTWRFVGWTESTSSRLYVNLDFKLLSDGQRFVFCFPKDELHALAAITFDGQELVPRSVEGCKHVQHPEFWLHHDPLNNLGSDLTTSAENQLLQPSHALDRTRTETTEGSDRKSAPSESSPCRSESSRDHNSQAQIRHSTSTENQLQTCRGGNSELGEDAGRTAVPSEPSISPSDTSVSNNSRTKPIPLAMHIRAKSCSAMPAEKSVAREDQGHINQGAVDPEQDHRSSCYQSARRVT